ncbi:hypothetical protein L5515_002516 [Caenorhabditis briggsae]|uniref:Uncharacterized protein n=1 Tax=Caenorhabditis briggsae TaxID=6238 RepID=A0AAE9E482_CAEBR|nr:hypothetical protein L5515_002516 [Caenorhabditis briggsae]
MKPKRELADTELSEGSSEKRFCEPGTSDMMGQRPQKAIELLEFELQQAQLNVQEIGRIIVDGMLEKSINDEILKELIKKVSKNVPTMANINLWNLSDDLSKGVIDSRLVVVGNAFLWNLLKSSMSTLRDKFDHYHFKMTTMAGAVQATSSSASSNSPNLTQFEFLTNRCQPGVHRVADDGIFVGVDLLDVYKSCVFRKTGDLGNKSKQFIKNYLAHATRPKCAIWHYSLRQSGASHKKWLQNIPEHVLDSLIHFQLSLAGLGMVELEADRDVDRGGFYMSLGDTEDARETTLTSMKMIREQLVTKFRQNVTDALNEAREMPFNTITRELMAPPRGKPIDMHHCVTWRQTESLIKRCELDPSKENLEAKQVLDYKLGLTYNPNRNPNDDEDADEIDVEDVK